MTNMDIQINGIFVPVDIMELLMYIYLRDYGYDIMAGDNLFTKILPPDTPCEYSDKLLIEHIRTFLRKEV